MGLWSLVKPRGHDPNRPAVHVRYSVDYFRRFSSYIPPKSTSFGLIWVFFVPLLPLVSAVKSTLLCLVEGPKTAI